MAGRRRSILALCLVTSYVFTVFPAAATETISYSYDSSGRLIKVSRSGSVNNGIRACYSYDNADNRSNVTVATSECSPPALSVSDVSATEGSSLSFVVTRSGTTTAASTVNYATSNGTAIAGSDYYAASNSLTFAVGEVTRTVSVTTINDSALESAETVNLTLSNPSGATISDAQGVGTINDDDTANPCNAVSFSISNGGAVTEGGGSIFTITKTGSTTATCSVNLATANGTAVAPDDYTTFSMTLPFANTQTLQSVSVTTVDDTAVESAENFTMNLSSPTGGAAIGTGAATGTINDNDSAPTLSISDAEGTEGGTLTFIVTKTGSASATVNYATSNGSAVAPGDYGAASGTLNFAATDATKTITIGLGGGTQVEADESFTITLSGASGATITDAQGVGTISDDDEGCPTC
jgi:hypothetical protein